MIPKNWNGAQWSAFKRIYPKTYMVRLHHVKKVDLTGNRIDKIKAIKDGYFSVEKSLIDWALENASDDQINEWYKDCK
tara:strand:- start:96 stop:329 length:234 start_codon:yes stop_codon:yes gene_type:complete